MLLIMSHNNISLPGSSKICSSTHYYYYTNYYYYYYTNCKEDSRSGQIVLLPEPFLEYSSLFKLTAPPWEHPKGALWAAVR